MKKRIVILAFLLVVSMICTACSSVALKNGIEYRTYSSGSAVRDITIWAGTYVEIDSEYGGKPVTSLGEESWFKLPSIYTTLILPETLNNIDRDFYDNASKYLEYNEYSNAYYLGTKDNPYFALVKAKEQDDTPTASAMNYIADDFDDVELATPATPPYDGYRSDITSCVIHPDTKIIAENAFEGCIYLESITVPGTIKVIPEYAFAGCIALERIVIEDGVEIMAGGAFEGCENLKEIILPNTLKDAEYLFHDLQSLKSINLPEGLTSISEFMFHYCSSLESITIPSSVTRIGGYAFQFCTSLEYVEIPNGVKSIDEYAFYNASSLTSIKIPAGLLQNIAPNAFSKSSIKYIEVDYSNLEYVEIDGSLYDTSGEMLIKYGGDPSVTSFTVPENVKYIAEGAFMDSTLEEIILPEGLAAIGMAAFYNCDALSSIYVPRNVTYIGDLAFAECDKIERFVFECLVFDFSYGGLFYSCDSLKAVEFNRKVDKFDPEMFSKCHSLEAVNMNAHSKSYYTFEGVIYSSISNHEELVYYPLGKKDAEFELPFSTEIIGYKAFSGNPYLEKIDFGVGNLYSIYDYAFAGCSALKEVVIRATASYFNHIGQYSFKDCVSLVSFEMPKSITFVGIGAFMGCTSLETVVLSDNLKNILQDTFKNCSSLKNVTLGNIIYFIEDGAFIGCVSLEKIVIPNYCLNIRGTVFEKQVEIHYDGTVKECAWESNGWWMFKKDSESGFYIICTDGKHWHSPNN